MLITEPFHILHIEWSDIQILKTHVVVWGLYLSVYLDMHGVTVRSLTVNLLFSIITFTFFASAVWARVHFFTVLLHVVSVYLLLLPVSILSSPAVFALCENTTVFVTVYSVLDMLFWLEFDMCLCWTTSLTLEFDRLHCLVWCHALSILCYICMSQSESVWIFSQTELCYLLKFLNHLIGSLRSNLLSSYLPRPPDFFKLACDILL